MTRRHLAVEIGPMVAPPIGLRVRPVVESDAEALARLMLDAYDGTVDADGSETIEDARQEVDSYFAGAAGEPMPAHSFVALDKGGPVAAVLVSRYDALPLVAYLMTAASHKGRGLAKGLVALVLATLYQAGERRAHLWVTAGNEPAERIYASLGFADSSG